jgi:hypothetical protein
MPSREGAGAVGEPRRKRDRGGFHLSPRARSGDRLVRAGVRTSTCCPTLASPRRWAALRAAPQSHAQKPRAPAAGFWRGTFTETSFFTNPFEQGLASGLGRDRWRRARLSRKRLLPTASCPPSLSALRCRLRRPLPFGRLDQHRAPQVGGSELRSFAAAREQVMRWRSPPAHRRTAAVNNFPALIHKGGAAPERTASTHSFTREPSPWRPSAAVASRPRSFQPPLPTRAPGRAHARQDEAVPWRGALRKLEAHLASVPDGAGRPREAIDSATSRLLDSW